MKEQSETKRRERGQGRIWQLNGGKVWWIQYYNSRGLQVRESSHSENRRKAQDLLNECLAQVANLLNS